MLLALLLQVVSGTSASAAIVSQLSGGGTLDSSAIAGGVDFILDWDDLGPIVLQVELEMSDFDQLELDAASGGLGDLYFAGLQFNQSGQDWTDFRIELVGGPTFSRVEDIFPAPDAVELSAGNANALLRFDSPIESGPRTNPLTRLELGAANSRLDPVNPGDPLDWRISIDGLSPGSTFQVRLSPGVIPEPATLPVWAVLAGLGFFGRRRRSRRR